MFQRFESDKQRTGVGRFSPIEVHDEAYRQIPVNLAKADQEGLFDRIMVYTRQPDGQLQPGLDRTDDHPELVNFEHAFDQFRQPIFDQSFYYEQWFALRSLAQQRGETNDAYLKQIDEFIRHYSQ